MLVQDFLQDSAKKLPNKTALVCGETRLTYEEIDRHANRLANALIENGMRRGDRGIVFLPNSVEAVISIFAILKTAGTFVVLNHTTKKDKLQYILNNCRAAVLITSDSNRALAAELARSVPSLQCAILCSPGSTATDSMVESNEGQILDFRKILATFPVDPPPCPTIDQDLACLIYTSGSTGEPKGVMSGHNNVVFASGSVITYLENVQEDIVINALPLSFDYGLYQLLMVFRFGGTLVLEKTFSFPAQILKRIQTENVTGFPVVPTMVSMMLQMDLNSFDLGSLRYMTNTAAALPPQHIEQLREKFPFITIYSMYGLTECKRTLYLPPDQLKQRPGSVGIAIPGTEVWLEDDAGNRLGPGQQGELIIRGSHVMRGYWEDPETTAKVYHPGPTPGERILYSGDLFRMDEDGYLYFVSRKDDVIKSRGEKVAPKEVESALYGIEGIVEVAVVGVNDPILGQGIKAYVVSKDKTLTEKEIKYHCSQKLENFMVPQIVEFRQNLPKTGSGKISKKDL